VTRQVRRELVAASAALVLAALLALVGVDALRWQDTLAEGDARYSANPAGEPELWVHHEALPASPARRLLGLDDDLAYRRAVRLYSQSRPGEPVANNPRREILRADAQRALVAVSRSDPDPKRRAQATMLVGLLAVGRGDFFVSPEERLQVLRGAIGSFQVALELDPENSDAKRNLELLLADAGGPSAGATDPGQGSSQGRSTGAGRSGSGY
jgi:hypothetical protein